MTRADLIRQVALGSRILYRQGVLDAFGHVSARDPENSDWFLMSRSMAPGGVTGDDVFCHDRNGDILAEGAKPFLERFIHAAIYQARPDVAAIVHSHSPNTVPFTVVPQVPLRPLCHMCGFLADLAVPFDVADIAGGATDLLIRNEKLGQALARHLAGSAIVLMRGHGFTAVGESVPEAVFRAVYTDKGAALQQAALRLGEPQYLRPEEARACDATTRGQIDRAWALWVGETGERDR